MTTHAKKYINKCKKALRTEGCEHPNFFFFYCKKKVVTFKKRFLL